MHKEDWFRFVQSHSSLKPWYLGRTLVQKRLLGKVLQNAKGNDKKVQTRQECGLTRGGEGQEGFVSDVGGFPLTVMMKANTIANGPILKIWSPEPELRVQLCQQRIEKLHHIR